MLVYSTHGFSSRETLSLKTPLQFQHQREFFYISREITISTNSSQFIYFSQEFKTWRDVCD